MTATLFANDLRELARLFRRVKFTSPLPILDQVLVTVRAATAELSVTNLDIYLAMEIQLAGPSTEGTFVFPRCELFTLAKVADRSTAVRFTVANGKVRMDHTAKRFPAVRECPALDPEDFPEAPEAQDYPCILPSNSIDAIRLSRKCASGDETRYVLNGVYLDPVKGGSVVATDGRRMVVTPARVPHDAAIVPNAVADLLVDPLCQSGAVWHRTPLAKSGEEDDNPIGSLTFGSRLRILFKLVQGNFPAWRQVLPPDDSRQSSYTFAPAVAESLVSWLRTAPDEAVRIENTGLTKLRLTRVNEKAVTTSTVEVPAAIVGMAPTVIMFRSGYLADALDLGLLTLDMVDEMAPGVATDGTTRCVLMPMRVAQPDAGAQAPALETVPDQVDPVTA